ncbi:TetR/AcrR family transcriptional regulator [Candidatus Fermentibacterales bacterium]|nr:TetR/AcrR family transcriptional regulator [Candidatus Fermentibacterales bacterium]
MSAPTPLEQDTKHVILGALIGLLGRKPCSSITMSEIAQKCGLTKPAIYYHFGSKKGLFVALAQTVLEEVSKEIDAIVQTAGTLREILVRMAARRIEAIKDRPDLVRAHIALILDPGIRLMIDRLQDEISDMMLRKLTPLFEEARKSGEIRGDVDPGLVLTMHHGALNAYVVKLLHGQPVSDVTPDPESMIDLIYRGLGAGGTGGPRGGEREGSADG